MKLWLVHHQQAFLMVLGRFKDNMLSTLLITIAIGVTLTLPVLINATLVSFSDLVTDVKKESSLSLFLENKHDDSTLKNIQTALEKNTQIKSFKYVSKDEALSALAESNGVQDLISTLEENPLPDAFIIEPKAIDANTIDSLKISLAHLDGVEDVIIDGAWLKRLNYLLSLGNKVLIALVTLLSFALFVVIGNTIRMQFLTHHAEIEVSQLIGATNSFIRRPFLYVGGLYGLFGALISIGVASVVIFTFNLSVTSLATEYQSNFKLQYPNWTATLYMIILSISLGLISSYLAVSKSLIGSKD